MRAVQRPRFHAPEWDAAEGLWLVVVLHPLVTGQWQRTKRWYRSSRDAWLFIQRASTDLHGDVTI